MYKLRKVGGDTERRFDSAKELALAMILEEYQIKEALIKSGVEVEMLRNDIRILWDEDIFVNWIETIFDTQGGVLSAQELHILGEDYLIIHVD